MNPICFKKVAKMHRLMLDVKKKKRKSGLTFRKMTMMKTYATRLRWTGTDITTPSKAKSTAYLPLIHATIP